MEEALSKIGLSPKEAHIYVLLLEHGAQTAAELAILAGEKRPNVYALLESLQVQGIILAGDEAVKRFAVADPSTLQRLLQTEQERQAQASASFQTVLPLIRSQYSLTTDKPGVVHMAGSEGFIRLLDDMARSTTDILLIASNDVPANPEDLKRFRHRLLRRKEAGVLTRALFHSDEHDERHRLEFAERGIDLRFLGEHEFKGEVAIYENNVVFTVYDPSLIVTVITNTYIAETMRTVFEQLWQDAK